MAATSAKTIHALRPNMGSSVILPTFKVNVLLIFRAFIISLVISISYAAEPTLLRRQVPGYNSSKCKDEFSYAIDQEVWSFLDGGTFSTNRCKNDAKDNVEELDNILYLKGVEPQSPQQSCLSGQLVSNFTQGGPVCASLKSVVYPAYAAIFERAVNSENFQQLYGISFLSTGVNFYSFRDDNGVQSTFSNVVALGFDPSLAFHEYCIEMLLNISARLWVDGTILSTETRLLPISDNTTSNFLVYSPTWWIGTSATPGSISEMLIKYITFNGLCSSPPKSTSTGDHSGKSKNYLPIFISVGIIGGAVILGLVVVYQLMTKVYLKRSTLPSDSRRFATYKDSPGSMKVDTTFKVKGSKMSMNMSEIES